MVVRQVETDRRRPRPGQRTAADQLGACAAARWRTAGERGRDPGDGGGTQVIDAVPDEPYLVPFTTREDFILSARCWACGKREGGCGVHVWKEGNGTGAGAGKGEWMRGGASATDFPFLGKRLSPAPAPSDFDLPAQQDGRGKHPGQLARAAGAAARTRVAQGLRAGRRLLGPI